MVVVVPNAIDGLANAIDGARATFHDTIKNISDILAGSFDEADMLAATVRADGTALVTEMNDIDAIVVRLVAGLRAGVDMYTATEATTGALGEALAATIRDADLFRPGPDPADR
jgi:hypothetical protein